VVSALPKVLVRSELITTRHFSDGFQFAYQQQTSAHDYYNLRAIVAKIPAINIQVCVQVLIHVSFILGSH
jgi:hypothetical protein